MFSLRWTILVYVLLGLALVEVLAPRGARADKEGNCGHAAVTVVNNDPNELIIACRALNEITAYFRSIGFDVAPRVSLIFADRSSENVFAHGYFDARQSKIVVYRKSNVSPWGKRWTSRMAGSFLRHELAHMAIWEVVSGGSVRLRPEWHEFIAYAIQFALMEPQLRNDVLVTQAHVVPFETFMEVNEFTSRMNPQLFAVAAYKTYLAKGSRKFVEQLLRAEIVPTPFSYPFPVLPGQVPAQ